MRLATINPASVGIRSTSRDGKLVLIDNAKKQAALVADNVFPDLRSAIENWAQAEDQLKSLEQQFRAGNLQPAYPIEQLKFKSPLPRAWAFLDGSSYLEHVRRVRKSRGAEPPADLETNPLMYQGLSDEFFDPNSDLIIYDEKWGFDLEAEIAVAVDDVPLGVKPEQAEKHIKLVMLLNDVSLRELIPAELAKGFGFLQGKPSSSFAPYALTLDELGDAWRDGKAHLSMECRLNDKLLGKLDTGEMHFSFPELIAHAAKTRKLSAGTIVGSGTVSNKDESRGVGCLVEKRVLEIINNGKASTPYLKSGDLLALEAFYKGQSVFGQIKHRCILP